MAGEPRSRRPELWGGIECTVNRVGNAYHDQVELSGHASRDDDLQRIAGLGITVLRYPVLWERHAPEEPGNCAWQWADERMAMMRELGITPIVGLLHHGSGPRYTSLTDELLAEKFAGYARAVASRYPWMELVTPINEPLTTARFSGLYGHWYPHASTAAAFSRMIVNQCLATSAAMRAIRGIIPHAQLVQTEDVARISGTDTTAYQADFENERKWLTFDLLAGRVDESHPMWSHLALDDFTIAGLENLATFPCPPDIVGVNYYVTSDRLLDGRVHLHDASAVVGNGRDCYADIEAARALASGIAGHEAILTEAWNRYGIPVALTEVHLGCTREHQVRWLAEAWHGAQAAGAAGVNVRAVTAWSLFGSHGWESLVTREPFEYECGAFDVRSGTPRETAVAQVIREIVTTGDISTPVALEEGWWRRPQRFSVATHGEHPVPASALRHKGPRPPILITGARGTLGSAFVRVCRDRGLSARAVSRAELDISNEAAVRACLSEIKPWAIVNAAGYVRVEDAETESASCFRTNSFGVQVLARECARAALPFLTFSSDLVFDGSKHEPYIESDAVSPLSVYGASKAHAERHALEAHDRSLVVRTSAFFGPWDEHNFIALVLRTLTRGLPFQAASDAVVSPTYVPDLVNAALDLLIDGEKGVWHLANRGERSWSALAEEVADRAGLSSSLIHPVSSSSLGRATHPRYSVLGTERHATLPTLDDALNRWFSDASLPELAACAACN